MSAWSDWVDGFITDDQYASSCAREQWEEDHFDDVMAKRFGLDKCEDEENDE